MGLQNHLGLCQTSRSRAELRMHKRHGTLLGKQCGKKRRGHARMWLLHCRLMLLQWDCSSCYLLLLLLMFLLLLFEQSAGLLGRRQRCRSAVVDLMEQRAGAGRPGAWPSPEVGIFSVPAQPRLQPLWESRC